LPFITDTADQLQERDVLFLKIAEELLGDAFDVEGGLQPPCNFDNADVSFGVEIGKVEDHLVELAEEEVARLTFEIEVIARDLLTVLPLDPVPEALRSLSVDEYQEVLVMEFGDFFLNARACLGVWDRALVSFDLQYDGPGQFGDVAADEIRVPDLDFKRRFSHRSGPTQLIDEETLEVELPEAFPGTFDIEGHGVSSSYDCLKPNEQMIRGSCESSSS
jgi:hypothetical protein